MFRTHFKRELTAYAHGELPAAVAERVARHLDACRACRGEFDAITLGIRLAEHMRPATAPAELWDNIEAELLRRQRQTTQARAASLPAPRLGSVFATRRNRLAFAALALALAFGSVALVAYRRATRPAWEVTSLEGAPRVDAATVKGTGRLGVGKWLETDGASRARLQVADIGQVEGEPDTRVRLVETKLTEHRLELERGRISARIWAPPRLFYVNTPSAVAEDLGCAYTLEVDGAGRSLLRVTHGWVALVLDGRESVVPAGAACATQPGTGPGTPFFEDAPEALISALARFDFDRGGRDSLRVVVAEARLRDTLTLWHLLPRVEPAERARVYERLAALDAPPEGVTREGVLALDREMLDAWKEKLDPVWVQESFPAVRRAWRQLWNFKK